MEWLLVLLALLMIAAIANIERQAGKIRRDVARLDRKPNVLLKHAKADFDEFVGLSGRVKELARDPLRKIEAIKIYRDETGTGLAEAKEAIEAFIDSLGR